MPLPPDPADPPIAPAVEDALFQRLVKRFAEAGQAAADAAGVAAAGVRGAASALGDAAGGRIAENARDAADFVQKHPGVLALGAIGPAAPLVIAAIGLLEVKRIVNSRKAGAEPTAQLMFRVPESLRDDVRRLSVDQKRPMEELLTEAVLLVLARYGRGPSALLLEHDAPKPPPG